MNLQAIAGGVVNAINPSISITWRQSRGYIAARDGSQGPAYLPDIIIQAQVQPLAMRELQHLDGLNIQGTLRAIYMTGEAAAAIRTRREGGDIFVFADPVGGAEPLTWLTVQVLETWPDWCKVIVQLQTK